MLIHKTVLLVILLCSAALAGDPCSAATWHATLRIAGPEEVPIRIEGRVFRPDGKSPASDVVLYVYQTGSDGRYGRDADSGPLIRAWLRTDKQGRYRYDTIRPAPYPGRQDPAHIHIQFWGSSTPLQYSDDLYFDDEQLVSAPIRARSSAAGMFANVIRLELRNGILTGEQNFRLKTSADRFEDNILHGVSRCR